MQPTVLHTKGLSCPLPVLRARKAMKSVAPGGILEGHATDPGSAQDFTAFGRTSGATLVGSEEA